MEIVLIFAAIIAISIWFGWACGDPFDYLKGVGPAFKYGYERGRRARSAPEE